MLTGLIQYNENIQDLLGKADNDTKHEVKHEKGRTSVTDATIGEESSLFSLGLVNLANRITPSSPS
jgi:hypothetical protein